MENLKIVRSKRSSIAIHILPDGTVEVRAPKYIPEFAIKAFVKSKKDWIEKRLIEVKKHKPKLANAPFIFSPSKFTI